MVIRRTDSGTLPVVRRWPKDPGDESTGAERSTVATPVPVATGWDEKQRDPRDRADEKLGNPASGSVAASSVNPADRSGDLCRLNKTQRSVLQATRERAAVNSAAAHPLLLERLKGGGFSESELEGMLKYLRERAQITINFNPDKILPNAIDGTKNKLIDAFLADGRYRNQFESGISGGSLTAFAGGSRDFWEKTIFANGYHGHPLVPEERPKYGALNSTRAVSGGAPTYGTCYMILKEGVGQRTTFTGQDSGGCQADAVGTIDHLEHVLLEWSKWTGSASRRSSQPQRTRASMGPTFASTSKPRSTGQSSSTRTWPRW